MVKIDEIAPDVYRLSTYVKQFDLQFNHFLVKDEEPLLYHTGMRMMFPELRHSVSKLIPVNQLRWLSWSHFEVDECGALNHWLEAAPSARPTCTVVGAMVNITDFADRAPQPLEKGAVLTTGKYRFRLHPTPHLPHGWDAGALFEETQATLFCSDLIHQAGEVEALTSSDKVLERTRDTILNYQAGPLMDYMPYTANTKKLLGELAAFKPKTLAIMHGSSYTGDGGLLLEGLDPIYKEVFGGKRE